MSGVFLAPCNKILDNAHCAIEFCWKLQDNIIKNLRYGYGITLAEKPLTMYFLQKCASFTKSLETKN